MHEPDITLRGWLGSDVTVTETARGPVASFRVGSTPRRRRDGGWEDLPPVWFTVKAWDHLGRNLAASLRQGDPVVVHGRFVAEAWRRDDGTRASRHVVVAHAAGHDLRHGVSLFERRRPERAERPDEWVADRPVERAPEPPEQAPEPVGTQAAGEAGAATAA